MLRDAYPIGYDIIPWNLINHFLGETWKTLVFVLVIFTQNQSYVFCHEP